MRRLSVPQQRALIFSLILVCGGLFVAAKPVVHAATTSFSIESVGGQVGLGDADLKQVILNVLRWALGFLTLAAVSYMIYGGVVWMTAAGNESRVEKAKQIILQAAIGMVIVLLAWAIVLFVARTFANTVTNGNTNTSTGGCTNIDNCGPGSGSSTFDITAINTCAVPPNTHENVPRSSAVSFTFNTDLKTNTANLPSDPIYRAVNSGDIQINKCVDADCNALIDTDNAAAGVQNPKPINNQVYTPGATTAGTEAAPLAEWLAIHNTLTFYHLSFSDVAGDTRVFEPDATYQIRLPKESSVQAIVDVRDRILSYCRSQANAVANDIPSCQDSADGKYLQYRFKTSLTDINGQAMAVASTTPSSNYLTNTALNVDRDVPRSAILGINFSAGIDPVSVTTGNFRVYKITGVPDNLLKGTCSGGECSGTQIDPSKYVIRMNESGTGAWLQFADANEWYEPFTWYKVVVENMRNLCGSSAPKQVWAFETNDVTPGVDFVYPANEFGAACSTTEVFAQFRTSMWDITKGTTCTLGQANSFSTKALVFDTTAGAPVTVRTFDFTDKPPSGSLNANQYCKRISFDPATSGLPTNHQYAIGLKANRVVNQSGDTLQYGDAVPGFTPATGTPPWHFTTKPAGQCYQTPYISYVSPGEDKNGACVSVVGNYFEKVGFSDATAGRPETGDTLTFGGIAQGNTEIKSWSNGSIVNKLNAGSLAIDRAYDYQVGVQYPDPVNQVLLSNKQSFMLRSGGPTRPCLTSLSPSQGYPSDTFTANGEDFGSTPGVVQTTNQTPWAVTGSWSGTQISGIQVRSTAVPMSTAVRIVQNGVPSNALDYHVLDRSSNGGGTSTAPEVVDQATCNAQGGQIPSPNPYRNDAAACLNSTISVRFTTTLDPTTVTTGLTGTVRVLKCTGAVCDQNVSATVVTAGTLLTVTPSAALSPVTRYEVQLTTGIKGTPPAPANTPGSGLPMASEYRWNFTTKNGTEDCVISDVHLNPSGDRTVNDAQYTPILMSAQPIDNACHTLTHNGLTFTWASSNVAVGVLNGSLSNTTDDIKALAPPAAGAATGNPDATKGVTNVTVSAQSKTSTPFSLTYNPVACTTNSDCTTNRFGESCGASTCNAGRCTPVVNAIVGDNGPIGSWPTIEGCWLGDSAGTVLFSDNKTAITPDPAMCGNGTWTNERIIREVPAGAVDGPVKVIRADTAETTLASGYRVTTAPLDPQICKAVPASGVRSATVTITGRGLGTKGATDNVTFTAGSTAPVAANPTATDWTATSIVARVPAGATTGPNDIQVQKGNVVSNPLPYTVLDVAPGSCARQCVFGSSGDTFCAVNDATTACGYPDGSGLGCCVPKPNIVETRPAQGSTNMCRNVTPQIVFDRAIDGRTVTNTSVSYLDGVRVVDGSLNTSEVNGRSTITYQPKLITANNRQTLALSSYAIDTSAGITVANASFETATNDVPTGWTAQARVKQSTDVPPGHSGFSVLADCSTCTSSEQSYIAQNIANTHTAQASYRVTAWVKVEMSDTLNGTNRAGFITRCANNQTCPYDLQTPEQTPGLFAASTGGWKFIDFIIQNTTNSPSDISLDCFANRKAKAWCDDITVTRVLSTPTTIRGQNGALINTVGSPLTFTAGGNICSLDAVAIEPTSDRFTQQGETHPDATHSGFTAYGMSLSNGVQIDPVSGQYEWKWNWSSEKPTVASSLMTSSATSSASTASVTANANGATRIQATATITKDTLTSTQNATINGSSDVRVQFCSNPWKFTGQTGVGFADQANNCDVNNASCNDYHFSLFYCRDGGSTLLPNFTYTGSLTSTTPGSIEGVNTTDPTRLKSFFFKESATSRDTIGLLVFKNDDFLSPSDWFKKRFPLDTGASSTVVAGYPAVKSGTTTYIGVTNYTGSALQGLMFVFDYNSNNASPDTVAIAGQMMETMVFNTNVPNAVQREQLIRDTKRQQDLAAIKIALTKYKAEHGAYPTLDSGSYITGFSTSKWPSWQTSLGGVLETTLPVDPSNTFSTACAAPYESATCWAESTKTFSCPANSQLYAYRNVAGTVDLYATMEYRGAGSFVSATPPTGICTSPSSCNCFNTSVRVTP